MTSRSLVLMVVAMVVTRSAVAITSTPSSNKFAFVFIGGKRCRWRGLIVPIGVRSGGVFGIDESSSVDDARRLE